MSTIFTPTVSLPLKPVGNYVWDNGLMQWVPETQPTGGGGGGGAVTVADGADVAEGSTADAAWSGVGSGTVVSILKKIATSGSGGGAATIADGADVTEGAIADAAVQGDNPGTISAKLRGLNKSIAAGIPIKDGASGVEATVLPGSTAPTGTEQPLVVVLSPFGNVVNAIGEVTADQGVGIGLPSKAWDVSISDRTGGGVGPVKVLAASTPSVATDKALVVGVSPNSPLPTGSNTIGSIANTGFGVTSITDQTASGTLNGLGSITLTIIGGPGSGGIQINSAGSQTFQFEASVNGGVFTSLPCFPVAGGASVTSTNGDGLWLFGAAGFKTVRVRCDTYTSGSAGVTIIASTAGTQVVRGAVATTPPSNASTNVAQFGGANVVTGTGASGAGIPRFTISSDSAVNQGQKSSFGANQSWYTQITDTTNGPAAVTPFNQAAQTFNPALVVALSPNSPVPAGTNVIGSVTNDGSFVKESGGNLTNLLLYFVQSQKEALNAILTELRVINVLLSEGLTVFDSGITSKPRKEDLSILRSDEDRGITIN